MNGKKAREIRELFKKNGYDVTKEADYRVKDSIKKVVNIGGRLFETERVQVVNQTKYGYRRAKKDLIRGHVEL